MEVIIAKGEAKEIAALVLGVQERQSEDEPHFMIDAHAVKVFMNAGDSLEDAISKSRHLYS